MEHAAIGDDVQGLIIPALESTDVSVFGRSWFDRYADIGLRRAQEKRLGLDH